MQAEHIFCDLAPATSRAFDSLKCIIEYPKGAILFFERHASRGTFILRKGLVKLTMYSPGGKRLTMKIAKPGDFLGLSATVSGMPYELTAEAEAPCEVNFVRRDDFLRFMKEHNDACFRVAEQLSHKHNVACREIRAYWLVHSAEEKLAKLLLEWVAKSGDAGNAAPRLKLALTHEEIAQMIGTSRETVTRVFADLKKRQILHFYEAQTKRSTMLIRNKAALKAMAAIQ